MEQKSRCDDLDLNRMMYNVVEAFCLNTSSRLLKEFFELQYRQTDRQTAGQTQRRTARQTHRYVYFLVAL